ncbi:unnamed protein product [Phytophthora fragariaefolia]|uniref:Unnamed protein product n=1 Tax=Phytophthora fragariaefolia TaxID=1490495 RepID=A0A9W6WRX7_9STRA|nr:unnamed protein product [Phytophthora fragariaefolia]
MSGCFSAMVAISCVLTHFAVSLLDDKVKSSSALKKRQHSPHISVQKKQKLEVDDNNNSCYDGSEELMCAEYIPRPRASNHDNEYEVLAKDDNAISNVVPGFPSGVIEAWAQFDKIFKDYKLKNNLKFRVRSSETTTLYNRFDLCIVG